MQAYRAIAVLAVAAALAGAPALASARSMSAVMTVSATVAPIPCAPPNVTRNCVSGVQTVSIASDLQGSASATSVGATTTGTGSAATVIMVTY